VKTGGRNILVRCIFAGVLVAACITGRIVDGRAMAMDRQPQAHEPAGSTDPITLFLTGDVMLGRGIDQILPHPGDPAIHESYLKSARGYVDIAERAFGPIPRPVDWTYVWGDVLGELARLAPDVRMINLETSITASDDYWPEKGINYRMHPDNIAVLAAAGIDYCSLANNHTIDWGYRGLAETLDILDRAGIRRAGAGNNFSEAERPAVLPIAGKGRVLAFSYGMASSGIPPDWAAAAGKPGVNLLSALSEHAVRDIRDKVLAEKRPGDIVLFSIHWGGNWGYRISSAQRAFAHQLIDQAGVDIIHGHSSHHVMGLEVYNNKPIFYGCGDFLNDYEGIGGNEEFRGDLGLMYFVTMEPATGRLVRLQLIPTRIKHFRINRASADEARLLQDVLNRESGGFGLRVEGNPEDRSFTVRWP
jgi:poly-gamma-glutamate synthesis protein (capsule biosynthesis protein)